MTTAASAGPPGWHSSGRSPTPTPTRWRRCGTLFAAPRLRLEQQQRSARGLRRMIGGLAAVAAIAVVACVVALIASRRANALAADANRSAAQAKQSEREADQARAASEKSREAAEGEAYRAVPSEARALRAGREPAWPEEALAG